MEKLLCKLTHRENPRSFLKSPQIQILLSAYSVQEVLFFFK